MQLFPNGTSFIHVPNRDDTKDRISTHLAVIGDYVASCITLVSPNKVPAGNEYHVSHFLWYLYTVQTAYSVIGYSAKSDIVSTLGWYGIPHTNSNNYWI